MLASVREKLRRLPTAVTYAVALLLLAVSAVTIYRTTRPDLPPPGSRFADVIYRKCTEPGCGHVVGDRRLDLVTRGHMPLDRVEEPLGEGRRCPRCGKLSLRFAIRNAEGQFVAGPVASEED